MAVGFRLARHWPSQMLIVAAASIFIIVEAVLASRDIAEDKAQTIETAYAHNEAVALALNAHVTALFEMADGVLQQLAAHVAEHHGPLTDGELTSLLALHTRGLPMLRGVLAVNPDGVAIASSNGVHGNVPNLREREAMRHHLENVRSGLHIAAPVQTRDGVWLLPMSRAVRQADGSLRLLLVATVALDDFRAFYDARPSPGIAMELGLVDDAGRHLAGVPFVPAAMGAAHPLGTRLDQLAQTSYGRIALRPGAREAERLYAYCHLDRYGVLVYAGQRTDDVLASWRVRSGERVRALAGLSVLLLALAFIAVAKVGRLSRSEERLELAARAADTDVWELDVYSGHMWRSQQWRRLSGYAPGEVASTLEGFLSVVHPEDVEAVRTAMQGLATSTSTEPMYVEFRLRRKDGEERWMECSAHVLQDRNGVRKAVGSMRDISQRKQVELSLRDNARMLALAQRAADAGVWSIDFGTGETHWSEGCYRLHGFSPVEPPPGIESWRELILEPDRERAMRIIEESIAQHSEFSVEYRILHPDKGVRWLWTLGNAVEDARGQPQHMAGITLDITARKEAEEERQALLAREREARAEAERASRAKEEFLATISHELRTPLNAILGWAHVLRSRDKEPELVERSIDAIERNALAQAQLIADLLDISRIEAGTLRLDLEVVSIKPILEAAANTMLPIAESKGVWLHCRPLPFEVRADPARLQQVMWNLLSNAIKFTPKGGAVDVSTRRVGNEVEIQVRDTGVGIPREFLPQLFQRFSQVRSDGPQIHGGLGLGLAIVKHLVETHGGRVAVDSEGEGCGTVATVCLPLAEPARVAEPHHEYDRLPPVSLQGVSVLLVDDDADSREVEALVMAGYGAEVRGARSVDEACTLLRKQVPDVLVADLSMPEKDGFDLIRRIRQDEDACVRALPAIALSALASAEDRTRAIVSGFDLHLSKPVEPPALVEAVARLAARYGNQGTPPGGAVPQSKTVTEGGPYLPSDSDASGR